MSVTQTAILRKEQVPSRSQWQKAIDEFRLPFELDPDLVPFDDSGFCPCKLKNKLSGFEIYYDSANEFLGQNETLRNAARDRDYSVTFVWGGDEAECASALIAGAALVKSFGAIIVDDDWNIDVDFESMLADARELMNEI